MSTIKSKKLQVGTDASASNNFTIYQPATPDGTLRIGQGTADNPTEVGRFDSNGYVATNAPAFNAVNSSGTAQTIAHSTWTKLTYATENFDTTGDYDNSTNYRFTPSVEGYYQVNGSCGIASLANAKQAIVTIYKNGSEFRRGSQNTVGATQSTVQNVNALIYMNGSTDYIELYVYHEHGSNRNTFADAKYQYFSAFLARAI